MLFAYDDIITYQGIRSLSHLEYEEIFKPSDLASAAFRQMKVNLLQHEADLFACMLQLHGHSAL